IRKLKRELYEFVVNHSAQSFERVETDFDRDYWMTASEAKEYGLVDEVLLTNPRKEKKDK
ncbi:MAG: ATP-dependent Clp protease proteolytic subunit, partial [Bacteroidota bacterium]|nr:ATP-dependent Clp protease proteolytic subunit [Bacteroidota bacterium]